MNTRHADTTRILRADSFRIDSLDSLRRWSQLDHSDIAEMNIASMVRVLFDEWDAACDELEDA